MALGLLAQPRAPAAQEQQTPQKAVRQSEQPKASEAPAAQNHGKPEFLNPFVGHPEAIAEGPQIFIRTGCEGCHGAMGGSFMCPPLIDDQWKFGGDDDTLFKLIKGGCPGQTMPAVFGKVLTNEQVWKILAWVRSIYKGDPRKIVWETPAKGGTAGH